MCSEIRTHFYFQLPKYGIFGRKKRKQMLVISIEFQFSTKSIMLRIHLPPPVKALKSHDFKAFYLLTVPTFVPTSVLETELRLQKIQRFHTFYVIT